VPSSLRPPKPAGGRQRGQWQHSRLEPRHHRRHPTVEAEPALRPQPNKIDSEANRRTITVLFADLSGFTTMSERLDPEVMQTLQNELFAELTSAVQGFGGFVDKFIGDALLALFGAPAAHEDRLVRMY
jgi:class 3 adenylate cyclase